MSDTHVMHAAHAPWRPSNQMRVDNVDIAKATGATELGMRLWHLAPGQASTRHRHRLTAELYVVLEGTGRIRVDGQLHTLAPHSAIHVAPHMVRQVFNDTDEPVLWLIAGAPNEDANTLAMDDETMAFIYPDGPQALPPELATQAGPLSERS